MNCNTEYKKILESMLQERKAQLKALQDGILNLEDAIKRLDK